MTIIYHYQQKNESHRYKHFETTLDPHFAMLVQTLNKKNIPFDMIPPYTSGKDEVIVGVSEKYYDETKAELEIIERLFADNPALFQKYKNALEEAYIPPKISWVRLGIVLLIPTTLIVGIVYLLFFRGEKQKPSTHIPREEIVR